ncbi:MAG: sulfatase-like hydrolase/transferase [bacterium]
MKPRSGGPRLARLAIACVLVALVAGRLGGCAKRPPADPPDVLLVTFDTLRSDRWGTTGDPVARTPWVDRIARTGEVYPEARAAAPVTLPSHTTILTGVPPVVHGVRDNGIFRLPERARTVAEAFRDAGYATGAAVSAFPLAARFGLDRGFDHYDAFLGGDDEAADAHLRERSADVTVTRVLRWLDGARAPEAARPLFLWVHFFDPHAPYRPPFPWDRAPLDAYRGEIAHADREFGVLLHALERRRGRERLVLVTSDHGEGLGEHGESTHGVLAHLATLRVPIALRGPGVMASIRLDPVASGSIPATLLAYAGIDASTLPDAAPPLAESVGSAILGETLYPWFNHGWRGSRVVELDGWRLVENADLRLFEPATDPAELHDLAAARPDVVRSLRDRLEEEWERERERAWPAEERALSPDEIDALQALGYAGGGTASAEPDDGFRSGANAWDRVRDQDRTNAAITLLEAGNLPAATSAFEALVRDDPGNRMAWQYLGSTLLRGGDAEGACRALERALSLGPNPDTVWFDLADAEIARRRPAAAEEALRGALGANPSSVAARVRLATLLAERGEVDAALALAQEAIENRPRAVGALALAAGLCRRLGRMDEARGYWRRIVELEPEGAAARAARAELETNP